MILYAQFSVFAKYVKTYYKILRTKGAEILVAVFDNDNANHDERLKIVKDGLAKIPEAEMITASGIAIEKMEAWLLSDVFTLSQILSIDISEPPTPETIEDPKNYLERIFATTSYIVKDQMLYSLIAEKLDKNKLIGKCNGFKRFHDEVSSLLRRQRLI
jgi:Domain of unknown function (DUF4276)